MESKLPIHGLSYRRLGAVAAVPTTSVGIKNTSTGITTGSVSFNTNTATASVPASGNGKAWTVANNIMGLLSQGADIYSQVSNKGAGNVVMENPYTGQRTTVQEYVNSQAQQNGISSTELMMLLMTMMQQQQKQEAPPAKDNTTLYIGLAVGVVVLAGVAFAVTRK